MPQDVVRDPAPVASGAGAVEVHAAGKSNLWALTLGSIGVVYGDIGTSPLYALRESDRKSTRLNSSHVSESRMPSSA